MKPIIVLYHGGKEYCDFEYFARIWIQDHLVAAKSQDLNDPL